MKKDLAQLLAERGSLDGTAAKLRIVLALTWPSVLAQMSNIVMEYIDAAMVGSLGAVQSAAIGLVATSTWLLWGLGVAVCTGFSVQAAHRIGAGDDEGARKVLRQSILVVGVFGCILGIFGVGIGHRLPVWLGGEAEVAAPAGDYFVIFAGGMPLLCLTFLSVSMLRSSGNMAVPGIVNVAMCAMDVIFNFFLIFPSRNISRFGTELFMPGAGLGVAGAAVGTVLAYATGGVYLYYYMFRRSKHLCRTFGGIRFSDALKLDRHVFARARAICWPVAVERMVMGGAQVVITAIVAPLGNAAIAANAFAVTAESLCYAPGYGVNDAASTLVGQSIGAGRKNTARSFARICVICGMSIMGALGVVMWILAPEMMAMFSTNADIISLGTTALRTEAWAEPMFGAAIVTYGVFVGAGYTVVPAAINFSSIWVVRITLSALLAPSLGLYGVWLAMCIELCVRGGVFLICLVAGRWLRKAKAIGDTDKDAQEVAEGPSVQNDIVV